MPDIATEQRGAARVISLNRPDRLNAFTSPMLGRLREAVEEAERDAAVVGIVITGAGRGFCAGFDKDALLQTAEEGSGALPVRAPGDETLFGYLMAIDKPVIGAINGVAAGGGFVLALCCDLRFAGPAGSFVTVFGPRGLPAEHGTSWLLPRLVGHSRALDLLFSSRRVEAEEALRIGLADRVGDDPVATACEYVEQMAATVAPRSVRDMKRQVMRDWDTDYVASGAAADTLMRAAFEGPDAREGAASLLEGRPPRFARIGESRVQAD